MGFQSQSISDQRVYSQNTSPTDTRNGNIWIDTSQNPPETHVYSEDSQNWENISPTETQVEVQAGGYQNIFHDWAGTTWEEISLNAGSYDGFQIRRTASGSGDGWDWEIIDLDGNIVDSGTISVSGTWVSVNFSTTPLESFRFKTYGDTLETEIDMHEITIPYHLHIL